MSSTSAARSGPGQGRRRARHVQAAALGRHPLDAQGSRGLLEHDPLGHAGPVRQQGGAGGKPCRSRWKDLLKPEYKGLIGYLNPASAAVGQVGVVAVNLALGGSYENLDAGIGYFKQLQANQPIVPTQTAYARVLSGEIPILLDYDFNAYRGKYTDKAPIEFVIPQEGTQVLPYVMGAGQQGPEPGARQEDARLHPLSTRGSALGQRLPAAGLPAAMPADVKSKFLADTTTHAPSHSTCSSSRRRPRRSASATRRKSAERGVQSEPGIRARFIRARSFPRPLRPDRAAGPGRAGLHRVLPAAAGAPVRHRRQRARSAGPRTARC